MNAYYDTSCLAKLYVPEPGSEHIVHLVTSEGKALPFTPLHDTELRNALALKAFRAELHKNEMVQLLLQIDSDIREGRLLQIAPDWGDTFRRANQLSAAYTIHAGCRTLDILHVAQASTLGCRRFITNNARQASLAMQIGMSVKVPD